MKQKIRKNCDTLASLGIGVCFFGIWSVIKSIMYNILYFTEINDLLRAEGDNLAAVYIFVLTLALIVLAMHLYIGICARSEGTRGKKHVVYIPLAILLAATYIFSIPYELDASDLPGQTLSDAIASIITDVTTVFILLHIAFTSIRVKLLMRQAKKQEAM